MKFVETDLSNHFQKLTISLPTWFHELGYFPRNLNARKMILMLIN